MQTRIFALVFLFIFVTPLLGHKLTMISASTGSRRPNIRLLPGKAGLTELCDLRFVWTPRASPAKF